MVQAVLEDWRTAPVSKKIRTTLGFIQKLTLSPNEVTPDDLEPLRVAGVSDQAITDAIYVCTLFNLIDRVADALGFKVPTPKQLARVAPMGLRLGYKPLM